MHKRFILFIIVALLAVVSCGQPKPENAEYVLSVQVEAYAGKNQTNPVTQYERDTVVAKTVLAAYGKGIQKYASVLMHVEQFPDSIARVGKLAISDSNGKDVVSTIPQTQRDSVIMNFIQFARQSTIPYYDRVKDFELKLMAAR